MSGPSRSSRGCGGISRQGTGDRGQETVIQKSPGTGDSNTRVDRGQGTRDSSVCAADSKAFVCHCPLAPVHGRLSSPSPPSPSLPWLVEFSVHFGRSGGIGRRAWFRSMCPQGRGGSSPLSGIWQGPGDSSQGTVGNRSSHYPFSNDLASPLISRPTSLARSRASCTSLLRRYPSLSARMICVSDSHSEP